MLKKIARIIGRFIFDGFVFCVYVASAIAIIGVGTALGQYLFIMNIATNF